MFAMNKELELLHRVITPVAKGVSYIRDVFVDREDGRQEAFVLKIAPGSPVHVDATMPEDGQFGMQEPSRMAKASVPANGRLLAAFNADFFDMTNGIPFGPFAKGGVIYKDTMPPESRFFGILRDGSFLIGGMADLNQYRNELYAVVGCRDLLVDDDRLPTPVLEPNQNRHPRTAVGFDKEGALYFVVVDGRNPGVSHGLYLARFGVYLKFLGLSRAANLDGGGSSTFALRLPEGSELALMNMPADGCERVCANGIAVSTLMTPNGVCSHVSVTPQNPYVLPGAQLQLQAVAIDDSGSACSLPKDALFIVKSGKGCVTPEGCYTAPWEESDDVIALTADNRLLSETTIMVRVPTALQAGSVRVLSDNAVHSLAVHAQYRSMPMYSSGHCFDYQATGDAGTVDANGLLTTTSLGGRGDVRIAVKNHAQIACTQQLVVAYPPQLLDIFDAELPEIHHATGEIVKPFAYSARHGETVLFLSSENSAFAFSKTYAISHAPSAIGMWIRTDDGELPHATLCVQTGEAQQHSVFVKGEPSDSVWTYVEAPLTSQELVGAKRMTLTISFTGQKACYVDSLRAVFGYTDDDACRLSIRRVSMHKKNEDVLIKFTAYMGVEGYLPYEAPIDYKRARVILDDTEMTNLPGHYGINKGMGTVLLHNITVTPGKHRLRFCARDLMNNQCWYDEIIDTKDAPD